MNKLELTTINQYNSRIKRLNFIAKQLKIHNTHEYKSIIKIFNYLKKELKLTDANLYMFKCSYLRSLLEHYKYKKKNLTKMSEYREFFKDLKYKVRPAIINIEQLPTLKEILKMIQFANERNKLIIFVLYISGLRNFEFRKIKLEDCKVNLESKRVSISILGKNSKKRIVYIDLDLFKKIQSVFKSQVYLFETEDNKKLSATSLQYIVREASKKIELNKKVTPKTLRISLLNHLYNQFPNIDRDFLSEKFGHTEAVREKFYKVFNHKDNQDIQFYEKNLSNKLRIVI